MKRLLLFVPSILLALFLFNSFVLIKKDPGKVTRNKQGLLNTVFKSTDGGQTWQDISKGLPGNLREDGIRGDIIYSDDKGLFLKVGNELYHNAPNAGAPFWTKEIVPDGQRRFLREHNSTTPGQSGIFAYNYWGANLKKPNGRRVWSPIFDHSHQPGIRSAFQTAGGTIFIGTNEGIFKTDNDGQTWKRVYVGGYVGHLAEADGVLLATGMKRILRSTDNGENWALVISDTNVVFDVKQINGGFAALISPSASSPRGIITSYDAGQTWQPSNAGNKVTVDSIWRTWNDRPRLKFFWTYVSQVGENLIGVHNDGIFKSSDKGKTWKLMLRSVDNKIFNLFGSGNVIYAVPSKGGC